MSVSKRRSSFCAAVIATITLLGMLNAFAFTTPHQARANDAMTASPLIVQDGDSPITHSFEGGAIIVANTRAGSVSYDGTTRTLTLEDARFDCICLRSAPDLTINLVGVNEVWFGEPGYPEENCFVYDYAYQSNEYGKSNVTFAGTGSAQGRLFVAGTLTIAGGSLIAGNMERCGIRCGNLVVSGGTTECWSSSENAITCDGAIYVTGGSFSTSADDWNNDLETSIRGNDTPMSVSCAGTFEIDGGVFTASKYLKCGEGFTMKQGTFSGSVYASGPATITGGTIEGNIACGYNIKDDYYHKNMVMSGGIINGNASSYNFTMQGGTVNGTATCSGNLTMSGGTISHTGEGLAVSCHGDLIMKDGIIKADKSDCVIRIGYSPANQIRGPSVFEMQGGTVIGTSQNEEGIYLNNANLVMTGGDISITNSGYSPIYSSLGIMRGGGIGGFVKLKGGSVTLIPKKPNYYEAIDVLQMENKPECLKSIRGFLSKGGQFISGGNRYKLDVGFFGVDVSLVEYGAKSTKPTFNRVKFGGVAYEVKGVGTRAFATPAGAKVKSATFKKGLAAVKSYAFTGAKRMSRLIVLEPKAGSDGKIKTKFWPFNASMSKMAFAKCGKNSGKGFTVVIGKAASQKVSKSAAQSFLAKKGLPKSSKVKLQH